MRHAGRLVRKKSKMPLDLFFEFIRNTGVSAKLDHHAEQLSALGHPARLQILRFVVQGDPAGTAAGDIQSHVDLPASTLSHHLKRLSSAGLLRSRNEGTFVMYSADFPALKDLTAYLWEDCCKRGKGCC
jgi:DNA-binding transcriptional ArsR family regulator